MNDAARRDFPLLAAGLRLVAKEQPEKFHRVGWKCTSTACAIGWLPSFAPETPIELVGSGSDPALYWPQLKSNQGCIGFHAIMEAYGLTRDEVKFLFREESYEDASDAILVADRIEQFLADH